MEDLSAPPRPPLPQAYEPNSPAVPPLPSRVASSGRPAPPPPPHRSPEDRDRKAGQRNGTHSVSCRPLTNGSMTQPCALVPHLCLIPLDLFHHHIGGHILGLFSVFLIILFSFTRLICESFTFPLFQYHFGELFHYFLEFSLDPCCS